MEYDIKESLDSLLQAYHEQMAREHTIRDHLLEQSRNVADLNEALNWLKQLCAKERQIYRREFEGIDFILAVRDHECAALSDELKSARQDLDSEKQLCLQLKKQLEDMKTRCRRLVTIKEQQVFELRSENCHLKKKLVKLVKEKDVIYKKTHSFFTSVQPAERLTQWSFNKCQADRCTTCGCRFSLLVRKNYCQLCNRTFCRQCANFGGECSLLTKQSKPRLCKDCHSHQRRSLTTKSVSKAYDASTLHLQSFNVDMSLTSEEEAPFNNELDVSSKQLFAIPDFLVADKSFHQEATLSCSQKTEFDEITDQEIASSLAASSPYTGSNKSMESPANPVFFGEKSSDVDQDVHISYTRFASEICQTRDGLSGETWFAPGFKYAYPILVENKCTLKWTFESSTPSLSYYISQKSLGKGAPEAKVCFRETFVPAETQSSLSCCGEMICSEGMYTIIFSCYTRFLPSKLSYTFRVENISRDITD